MLAMLLAITSTLVCWAFMPVAAMASALTGSSSDRHPAQLEIGGDHLVADGDGALQRLLRRHHRIDHLLHRGLPAHARNRGRLRGLERACGVADQLAQHGPEIRRPRLWRERGARKLGAADGGRKRDRRDRWRDAVDHQPFLNRSMVMEIISRACLMTCRLAS